MDPLSPRKRLDCRRLDLRSELYVVGVILENPSMYQGELCVEIMHVFGIEISPSTVCRTVMKNLDPPENGPPSPDIAKYLDPRSRCFEIFGPPWN